MTFRVRCGEFPGSEEEDGTSVGDLGAIADADASGELLLEFFALLRVVVGAGPSAGLGQRIAPRVGVVDRGDAGEVFVLEAVALVVLVAEAPEEAGEGIILTLALALVPSGGAEEVAAGDGIDGLHLFEADDGDTAVACGFDLGGGGENRYGP